ncbi:MULTISPECIES: hypothetical protein [Bradyrhizobium]|uniref:Uncharacterized protein n=1 Tax=Bradyrhizobium elkanii TaxID=29448 RepID=A0A4U6S0K2_BRAEL|nr:MULTISPECIES: hypothetical protein [Bradyrhizobium]MTV14230.1 hypothetical protein [Bradyrhizobium sp. BR2003]TKV81107.1 hypothetical protein FDV58_13255 [Bradyrhizobium elkanii]
MHRAIEARISQLTEIPVALYLTSILNAQDVLLKLGLPLIIMFLSGWIIIRRWVSTPGIAAPGFSPAASSALFAPVLLVMYFYVLQSSMQEGIAAHAELVMLYGVIFAPTFLSARSIRGRFPDPGAPTRQAARQWAAVYRICGLADPAGGVDVSAVRRVAIAR